MQSSPKQSGEQGCSNNAAEAHAEWWERTKEDLKGLERSECLYLRLHEMGTSDINKNIAAVMFGKKNYLIRLKGRWEKAGTKCQG